MEAAAAAAAGKTLDEVADIAQKYADNMASVTVKVTDATHPQNGMSFGDLQDTDLMEIGAGQHGEGGGGRQPGLAADEPDGEHDAGSKEKQCAQNGRGQTRQGELLHGATSENVY